MSTMDERILRETYEREARRVELLGLVGPPRDCRVRAAITEDPDRLSDPVWTEQVVRIATAAL